MKYSITIIILFTAIQSFGQFSKGDKALGGTLSFNTGNAESNTYGYKSSSFSLSPYFGVLVTKNLEIGGSIGYEYSHSEREFTSIYDNKSQGLSLGLYSQRYMQITDNFLFSITGYFNYAFITNKNKETNIDSGYSYEDESKGYRLGLYFVPGFIYFPSQKVAFRANIGQLGYSISKNKTEEEKSNSFGIDYGNIGLGVIFYFRKVSE
jgi:hypothetical protein